jgi:hypothetical protein
MSKSFCFFFQKEVLSGCGRVSLNGSWYQARFARMSGSKEKRQPTNLSPAETKPQQ